MRRILVCSAFLVACLGIATLSAAAENGASTPSSVGKLVVVGDSLGAGFQNFSLYDSQTNHSAAPGGQRYGFAAFFAKQAGTNLNLPLIAYPGIPPVLFSTGKDTAARGTKTGSREPQTLTTQTLNLSVPGYTVVDAVVHSVDLQNVSSAEDVLTVEVLGFPSLEKGATPCGVAPGKNKDEVLFSEAACAIQLQPDLLLVSLGSNDVLQSLIDGLPPTPTDVFSKAYGGLLEAFSLGTSAKIVVSNIPDVTEIPFLLKLEIFETLCGFAPSGAGKGDYVVPNIANPNTTTFNICTDYAVRPASLIAAVQTAVRDYNVIIGAAAQEFGATVVDVNCLFSAIAQNGYTVGKHHLTIANRGGIFSLDAVHPTNTGYAILANAFIETMNRRLGTKIPTVNVEQVADNDPLVFH